MAIFTAIAGWITTALVNAGWTMWAARAVGAIAGAVLSAAVSRALGPKPSRAKQEIQAVINQAAAYRVRGYGLVKLGGVRALHEASDGKLYHIVAAHSGPINAVLQYEIDGTRIAATPGTVTAAPWNSHIVMDHRLGGPVDNGDYPPRSVFASVWTSDHKLQGIATFYARMTAPSPENFSKIFPRGAHTSFAIVAELSQVYDPRSDTTGYSTNAALCLRDYLTHADGWAIPATLIDDTSFAAKADIDGQTVPLAAGGTVARYQVGGVYSFDEPCKTTAERLMVAGDAQLYLTPEGKVGVFGGAWSVPDVRLDEDDIIEISLDDGRDPFEEYNVLKGIFTSAEHDFKDTDAAEWEDTAALLTQPRRAQEYQVDMCPTHSQMRRLMKIRRMRDHREWVGTIRTKLSGIKARFPQGDGAHIIRVIWSELDIDGPFEVLSWSLDPRTMTCTIGIGSVWNAWAWNAATEEGEPAKPVTDLVIPVQDAKYPTGLVATYNSITKRIEATVDDPGRADLVLVAEIALVDDEDPEWVPHWVPMSVPSGGYTATSGTVLAGEDYLVRARWGGNLPSPSPPVTVSVPA